ncbi:MAG: sodium:solute symporter [Candidatus Poseidoniia archaeon]|jgi:Na+/proline symporter|nr:sodium:solute symporter [Candidatus Poseidoniia archaeon]MDP7590316.1 sodium:solute symporter [Candidatus Poseidoniia archaeon]MDP7607149.1 sodium:solute symporter [Candidatus Poseidoniia archaeon]HJP44084.1 sodium:solute symporter [Candidatus Poseidoniia archaeon]
MSSDFALLLMLATLGFFGWIGWLAGRERQIDRDYYLSARGTQPWQVIGLSLFASGMGIWILFSPSEVGYYSGFYDVFAYALSAATPFLLLAYLGPMVRERLPDGVTLADYVRIRLGRLMQTYVGIIAVLYMFTFLVAEFTAIGKAMHVLAGVEPIIPIVAVAAVTAAYTAYGGLPASLGTDRIQAWFIIWLLIVVALLMLGEGPRDLWNRAVALNPEDDWSIGSITFTSTETLKSGLALLIAITAAEMFSQGNWQRTWASRDDDALRRGAYLAAGLCFVAVLVMGFLGTVVAGDGAVADPSAAFFYLFDGYPALLLAFFVVMSIALVCSSVDTLQNAIIASSSSQDFFDKRLTLTQARWATLLLIPFAIREALEMQAESVFAIFLIADLLATATVLPVLLSLWDRVVPLAALAGAVAGLLSVVAYGAATADVATGVGYLTSPTNEWGLANLGVFLSALVGSGVVTVGGSLALASKDRYIK